MVDYLSDSLIKNTEEIILKVKDGTNKSRYIVFRVKKGTLSTSPENIRSLLNVSKLDLSGMVLEVGEARAMPRLARRILW
jgi:hypothetical protein